jgi:KipI family sensor histidine kinase inhibitor
MTLPPARTPRGIIPLGDAAVYVEFSDVLDLDVNRAVQRLAKDLRALGTPWIVDVVPALGGVALHFDADHPQIPMSPLHAVSDLVRGCLDAESHAEDVAPRLVEVPVCYDPELGLDLADVAGRLGLEPAEVARRHAAVEHRVLMVGFVPGHPYLGGLDPTLAVPRRASPRAMVPAGSVAIANLQTSIYPYAIPGGWSIVGRTPLRLFDAQREEPALLGPGDRVRFVPIGLDEFSRLCAGDRR